jgi:hypothetical protein
MGWQVAQETWPLAKILGSLKQGLALLNLGRAGLRSGRQRQHEQGQSH